MYQYAISDRLTVAPNFRQLEQVYVFDTLSDSLQFCITICSDFARAQ